MRNQKRQWKCDLYSADQAYKEFIKRENKRKKENLQIKRGEKERVPNLWKSSPPVIPPIMRKNRKGERKFQTFYCKVEDLDIEAIKSSFERGFNICIRHKEPIQSARTLSSRSESAFSPRSRSTSQATTPRSPRCKRRLRSIPKSPRARSGLGRNILYKQGIQRNGFCVILTVTLKNDHPEPCFLFQCHNVVDNNDIKVEVSLRDLEECSSKTKIQPKEYSKIINHLVENLTIQKHTFKIKFLDQYEGLNQININVKTKERTKSVRMNVVPQERIISRAPPPKKKASFQFNLQDFETNLFPKSSTSKVTMKIPTKDEPISSHERNLSMIRNRQATGILPKAILGDTPYFTKWVTEGKKRTMHYILKLSSICPVKIPTVKEIISASYETVNGNGAIDVKEACEKKYLKDSLFSLTTIYNLGDIDSEDDVCLVLHFTTEMQEEICVRGDILDIENIEDISSAWYCDSYSDNVEEEGKNVIDIVVNKINKNKNFLYLDDSNHGFDELFGTQPGPAILIVRYYNKLEIKGCSLDITDKDIISCGLHEEEDDDYENESFHEGNDVDNQDNVMNEEKAAVAIQAQFRGHQARKELKEVEKEEEKAATKIQARWKGHQTRKAIEKEKNKEEDATNTK